MEPLKSDAKIWNNLSPDLRPAPDTYPQGHGSDPREIGTRGLFSSNSLRYSTDRSFIE